MFYCLTKSFTTFLLIIFLINLHCKGPIHGESLIFTVANPPWSLKNVVTTHGRATENHKSGKYIKI